MPINTGEALGMQPKSKLNCQPRTALASSRSGESRQVKIDSFPPPPVMPDAWHRLRLLLSSQVADLAAIADVMRNDMGLMIELLRFPTMRETSQGADELLDIENLVVLGGIDQLQALAASTAVLPREFKNDARFRSFEHFSLLAQRAAGIAEQLAVDQGIARPEDAYAAALVRNLGALPSILGWPVSKLHPANHNDLGPAVAKFWGLPNVLIEVIRGDREACRASSRVLIDLANTAHAHALAIEARSKPAQP
jgi:HD-like signal output (HDOD) protein